MGREIDYARARPTSSSATSSTPTATASSPPRSTPPTPAASRTGSRANIPQEGLDPEPRRTPSCTSSRRRARPCRGPWSTRRSPCSRATRSRARRVGGQHRHPRRLGPAAPGDHEVPRRPAVLRRRPAHLERHQRQAGHGRLAAADLPRHPGPGPRDRAVPALRLRPVLHVSAGDKLYVVLNAYAASSRYPYAASFQRRELHARLGHRRHGRVLRRDELLRRRRERAHHADLAQGLPVDLLVDDRDARGPARAPALRRGPLQLPVVGAGSASTSPT